MEHEPDFDRSKRIAFETVAQVLDRLGGVQNEATAEVLRKMLLRKTIQLRDDYLPHTTQKERRRLPELIENDLSRGNLTKMTRVIRILNGNRLPVSFSDILDPDMHRIGMITAHILAILDHGKKTQ
jgi:hypothetical protein